ncbi:hypothetical protein [Sphingomonas sp. CV7422]|uniref:hypothetical protein n=1 Tax=Sphingomonas sp. CV7422 TaxID=3018036 RepID=UPI0022FE5437|nr:hypothetical protein [Sphingomonas sp. CV7422]
MTMLVALILLAGGDGPISKFSTRSPDAVVTSARAMGDVERCLIDADGRLPPNVYRQPDRPDEVTLLWLGPNGLAQARADIHREQTGSKVTSWGVGKAARTCAGA